MFKECLDMCNMINLGFSGLRFNWTNRRDVNDLIQERINRFFVNLKWYNLYPKAKVTHPTCCHSNHCPVLMETHPRPTTLLKRPFKFQSFWVSDPTFPVLVVNTWKNSTFLSVAIECFSKDAEEWNSSHFRNVFAKKRKLLAKINGIL